MIYFILLLFTPAFLFGSQNELEQEYQGVPEPLLSPEPRYPIAIDSDNLENLPAAETGQLIDAVTGRTIPWMAILFSLGGMAFVFTARMVPKKKPSVNKKWLQRKLKEKALQDIDELNRSSDRDIYLEKLSVILRNYIQANYEIHAPSMTTQEFLLAADNYPGLRDSKKTLIQEFLLQADSVKFAKHTATREEDKKAEMLARRFISE